MKSGKLFPALLLMPILVCHAQDNPQSTVAAPQTPTAPASATTATDSYVIGASDVLTVTVWREPTFSGSVLVRPDGMISLSLLGDIPAAGNTPLQLANAISERLKKFIQDPQVSVVLTQINSKKIFLLGEVTKKGPVDMTPGMTLLEAIASGGGLTDFANTRKIYVLRNTAGKQEKIPVQYKDALKGKGEFNILLQPGDTIVVP
jgi:polysaccharide export outer membrane protein